MDFTILYGLKVASEKEILNPAGERGICRKHIFKRTVFFTDFPYKDASVFLNELSLDFARMAFQQYMRVQIASGDSFSDLGNTDRT